MNEDSQIDLPGVRRKELLDRLARLCAEMEADVLTLQSAGHLNGLEGFAITAKITILRQDLELRASLGW